MSRIKGSKLSLQHKNKISLALKKSGHKPPSQKGNRFTKAHRIKISLSNKSKHYQRIGKTLTQQHRYRISLANKGKKHSKETRRKISIGNLGKKLSKRHRNILLRVGRKVRFVDTSIELIIEKKLKQRNITYVKQRIFYSVARVDFYLPKLNLVIEADGCYWHGCSIHYPELSDRRLKDIERDKKLIERGVKVIRFWEHEINDEEFIDKQLIDLLSVDN